MTDKNPHFGFRMEGSSKSSITEFVSSPFYFTKHRPIDRFNEREDIQIPPGKDAAGVWFYNDIHGLKNSVLCDAVSNPRIITRVDVSELKKDAVVDDRSMENASIAIAFYDPSEKKSGPDSGFVESLVVPDNLIDVWSGEGWLKKNAVSLLDIDHILHRAAWGLYPVPSAAQTASAASNQPIICHDTERDWRLPPPTNSPGYGDNSFDPAKSILRLYRKARHAVTLYRLQQEQDQLTNLAEGCLGQAEILKNRGNNSIAFHSIQAGYYQAEARRAQHEREMLLSGKTFWQLHDIDAWANHALRLERIDNPSLLYREVPQSAFIDLHRRMNEIRHQASLERLHVWQKENQLTLLRPKV